MGDVTRYTDGGREYAITGLETKAEAIRGATRNLDGKLAALRTAMGTALEGFRGPHSVHAAERHNAAADAVFDLYQSLSMTAMYVSAFPSSVAPSSYLGDAYARQRSGTHVPVPDGGGTVSAVPKDLRAYATAATEQGGTYAGLARTVSYDGLSAEVTYQRGLTADERQRRIEDGAPAASLRDATVPVTEPYPVRELIAIAPPTDQADAARKQGEVAAELVTAVAGAFERADQTQLDLLASNPELAAYLVPGMSSDHMAGDTVLAVLLAHLDAISGGDGEVDLDELYDAAEDDALPPEARAAAQYLLDNPTLLSLVDSGRYGLDYSDIRTGAVDFGIELTADDIRGHLEANENLRRLYDGGAEKLDHDGDGTISSEELYVAANVGDEAGIPSDLQEVARYLSENPRALAAISGAGGEFSLEALTGRLVNGQAYVHDPEAARTFTTSLPVAEDGGEGLPIDLVRDDGFKALANSALIASGTDLTETQQVISHLPETQNALRNELITAFYTTLGQRADGVFADASGATPGDPTSPGHGGANWLIFAPWASNGVHDAINGDLLGGLPPMSVRQAAADGNQWIFDDITARYAAFVELYESTGGQPSTSDLQQFFDTQFSDGDRQIRDGFQAYVAALGEDDPARRQQLMFQGNTSVAIHEQAGAQPYLDGVSLGPDGIATSFVDVEMGTGNVVDVDLDLPDIAGGSNLVDDAPILDMDPSRPGGVPTVPGVDLPAIGGWEDDFDVSTIGWAEANGAAGDPDTLDGTGATAWTDYEERMWNIHRLFEQHHTDPSLYDTSSMGRGFEDYAWLDPETGW
jgi:hypothetical protein